MDTFPKEGSVGLIVATPTATGAAQSSTRDYTYPLNPVVIDNPSLQQIHTKTQITARSRSNTPSNERDRQTQHYDSIEPNPLSSLCDRLILIVELLGIGCPGYVRDALSHWLRKKP
jgi:hypothetical protein